MIESEDFDILAGMQTIGDRIKHLRKDLLGLSQEEFARLLTGVTRGAVGNWELGKPISRESLEVISQKVGVSMDWLATGQGDGEPKPSQNLLGPVALPIGRVPYGGKVRAGEFLAVDEYFNQDEYADNVPSSITRHPDFPSIPQFAWLVQRDSMNEASIGDGTWVVAAPYLDYRDRIGELFNGQFVVVERTRHGGSERELTVKEVQFSRGGMRLIPRSSNPRHKEFFVPLDEDRDPDAEQITVLAVVLAAVRDLARPR